MRVLVESGRLTADSLATALLRAGASARGVRYPSGYEDVDTLLRSPGGRG